MKKTKWMGMALMGGLLAGCGMSLVKSAGDADDAKSKLFAPDSTRALVYVFRDDSFLGGKLSSQFVVNKAVAAKNERNRFNIVSLLPGKYEFLSIASNESSSLSMLVHNSKKVPLQITVESGNLYFLQEVFKPLTGFSLNVISPEMAEPIIRKGRLIALTQL